MFEPDPNKNVFIIRTSGRGAARGCRRLWGWTNQMREGRQILESETPLWLGTGFHYAMEDFHGYNFFQSPAKALVAYAKACRADPEIILPDDWEEALQLGIDMADYYTDYWLKYPRDRYKTLWIKGVPQVEVTFYIPIPHQPFFDTYGIDEVWYQGTLDRVIVDEDFFLWLVDYKTAIQFQQTHFETDPQITAYCWAGTSIYDLPIRGAIWQQHLKQAVKEPRILANGRISHNKQQLTTFSLYKAALNNLYGNWKKAPPPNIQAVEHFMSMETEEKDRFIRRDLIERNSHQIAAEGTKIILELEDMLNPNLPLYPAPHRFCGSCRMHAPCVALDAGEDWESVLGAITRPLDKPAQEFDSWRQYLKHPEKPHPLPKGKLPPKQKGRKSKRK